jgi:hypothetical protein
LYALGFYYSQNARRISLTFRWKSFGTKLDKIKTSIKYYLDGFNMSIEDRTSFVDEIALFLSECWVHFGPKRGKPKAVNSHSHSTE